MKIKSHNLSKDIYEHHPEIQNEITEYEVLFLLNEVSKMELSDPKFKDFPEYKGNSVLNFLDGLLPENKERKQFVSDLMEKYTLLEKTENGESIKPSDLYYKESNGVKEYRSDSEIKMLMEDLMSVAEEKSPMSTHYRHISYHDTQMTLEDRFQRAESNLIDLELVSKSGAIMYDQMPKK